MKKLSTFLVPALFFFIFAFSVMPTAAINWDEVYETQPDNYLPPTLVVTVTVNITLASHGPLTPAEVTPINSLFTAADYGRGFAILGVSMDGESATMTNKLSPVANSVTTHTLARAWEEHKAKSITLREILNDEDVIMDSSAVTISKTDYASDEKYGKAKVVFSSTPAPEGDRRSWHMFTVSENFNATIYSWTMKAVDMFNESLLNSLNYTSAKVRFSIPTHEPSDWMGQDWLREQTQMKSKGLVLEAGQKAYDIQRQFYSYVRRYAPSMDRHPMKYLFVDVTSLVNDPSDATAPGTGKIRTFNSIDNPTESWTRNAIIIFFAIAAMVIMAPFAAGILWWMKRGSRRTMKGTQKFLKP